MTYSSLSLSSESSSDITLSSVSFETFSQFWHRHKSVQDLADIQEHLSVSHLLVLQLQWTTCNTLSGAGFVVIHVTVNSASSMCHQLPMGEGAHIIPVRECLITAAWQFALLVQGITCWGNGQFCMDSSESTVLWTVLTVLWLQYLLPQMSRLSRTWCTVCNRTCGNAPRGPHSLCL